MGEFDDAERSECGFSVSIALRAVTVPTRHHWLS
jgi:hypothetical protein